MAGPECVGCGYLNEINTGINNSPQYVCINDGTGKCKLTSNFEQTQEFDFSSHCQETSDSCSSGSYYVLKDNMRNYTLISLIVSIILIVYGIINYSN